MCYKTKIYSYTCFNNLNLYTFSISVIICDLGYAQLFCVPIEYIFQFVIPLEYIVQNYFEYIFPKFCLLLLTLTRTIKLHQVWNKLLIKMYVLIKYQLKHTINALNIVIFLNLTKGKNLQLIQCYVPHNQQILSVTCILKIKVTQLVISEQQKHVLLI